ncbi:hypothetical protein [Paracoccus sp. (in: a-proteobacteria)]|uniref:hypothetical protein n=1 Tax=Paracoccus sp. TaxID=267 RepID=UPI0028B1E1CB|nr:hypothetical protein [Paracoccus sp. (in: a-proteobacteria)]
MSTTFTASLAAFRDKTKAQIQAVLSASVQDVMEAAQTPVKEDGRIPVDTGFLRNSLVSELNGSQIGKGPQSYLLATTAMQPGDVARFGWTAAYAMRMELGFVGKDSKGRTYNQQGRHFVEGAAAQWPAIVERNIGKLK